ncbi:MAG: hypothetical protein R3Y12_01020 [Clostridia bacterium]
MNALQDLVNSMQEMVEEAKIIPLSVDKCIIDKDQLLFLINETIRCLPEELDEAKRIVDNGEQFMLEAQKRAESIIVEANKKASLILREQEIVKQAEAEARDIVLNAKTKSAEIKKLATNYCNDSLLRAEENLAVLLEEVKTTRRKFNV